MTTEEMERLKAVIIEQVGVVAKNPDEKNIVAERLLGTFVFATKECLGRLEQHLNAKIDMHAAVLQYLERAERHDGRVAVRRTLEGKFKTVEDVQSWIDVWDPL